MNAYQFTALLDRGIVAVGGEDRISFLQGLITNNLAALASGQAVYAGLLTPQGKLLYDFIVVDGGSELLIDIARAAAPALVKRLTMYKLRAKVTIEDHTAAYQVAAIWGVAKRDAEEGVIVYRDPRDAALGLRVIAPAGHTLDHGAAQLSDAREYRRIRIGLGIGEGDEIGGETLYPLEANFELLHGVDFKKGCYVGQELTARMKHKSELRKRILPFTFKDVPGISPAPGTAIGDGTRDIGTLLAVEGANGLALIRLDRLEHAAGEPLRAGDATLAVHRPHWMPT